MTGSWLIGPTHQGPADKDIPNCEDCRVSLEDGDNTVHALDCEVAHPCEHIDRWDGWCPDCGDVEPSLCMDCKESDFPTQRGECPSPGCLNYSA